MPNQEISNQNSGDLSPSEEELVDAYREGLSMQPGVERDEHLQAVDDLVREMTDEERSTHLKRLAYKALNEAGVRYKSPSDVEEEKKTSVCSVDLSKIGWVSQKGTIDVSVLSLGLHKDHKGNEREIFLADLTGLNKETQEAMDLLSQGRHVDGTRVLDKLMLTLTRTTLPKLYFNIFQGKNVRPVNNGGIDNNLRRLDTTYTTYKEGVQGTNNRAMICILEGGKNKMVFGLMALYDHDKSDRVLGVLNTKKT